MTQNDPHGLSQKDRAAGFSRIFWAMPLLALTAGPMISVGQEQIIIDFLPDWLGFALIAAGAGRLMAIHPRAAMVRRLALVLNFLSIPLWVQYRRVTGHVGNLAFWVMPLWPLTSGVAFLAGLLTWQLCGIVADLAHWAVEERIRRRALSRRGLGLIMAVLTIGVLVILHEAPQWLMPAIIGYLICGSWVTCLMMGLMSQARLLCLRYEFTDLAQEEGDTPAPYPRPGLVSRGVAVAGVVLPLCLIPAAIWYYNDWNGAWLHARSHEVQAPEHNQVALAFLTHVKDGRPAEAYELTTPHFKERMSREEFKNLLARFPALREGPGISSRQVGRTGDWEPGYRVLSDVDGKHFRYTLFVRRPEPSFLVPRPPPAGVDEFTIEELNTPEARRDQRRVERLRQWNRGVALWQANRFEAAEAASRLGLQLIEEEAKESPKDSHYEWGFLARCHVHLMRFLARADRLEKAEAEFLRAGELFANLARDFPGQKAGFEHERLDCHAQWAGLLIRAGKAGQADKEFRLVALGLEKWSRDFPEHPPTLLLSSLINDANHEARVGKFTQAEEDFQHARLVLDRLVNICPSLRASFQWQLGSIHFDRCYARLLAGRTGEARTEMDQAKTCWKQHVQANHQAFQREKDRLETELANHPGEAYAHNNLAWFLTTCLDPKFRDSRRAVALAKRAVQLEPERAYLWSTLGLAHYRTGSYPRAVQAFEKASALGNDSNDVFFYLAMAHWQLGHKIESRQWLSKGVASMEKKPTSSVDARSARVEATFLLEPVGAKEDKKTAK
jgi:tetratricopeptide (TPR) repeat protein